MDEMKKAADLVSLFHYAVREDHPFHSDGQYSAVAQDFWQGLGFNHIAHTIAVLGNIIAIDVDNPIWKAAKFLDVLAGLYNKATSTFGLLTLDPAVLALVMSVLVLYVCMCCMYVLLYFFADRRRRRDWSSLSSTFSTTLISRPRSS